MVHKGSFQLKCLYDSLIWFEQIVKRSWLLLTGEETVTHGKDIP